MVLLNRRELISVAGAAPLVGATINPAMASLGSDNSQTSYTDDLLFGLSPRIQMITDGLWIAPADYAKILVELTSDPDFQRDSEGHGGVIEQLQDHFAEMTGKEKAIYMPTGTMANQLAVRVLAEGKSKVYVQQESHILNNEGDAAQELHGKRLVPLAPQRATFTLTELEENIEHNRRREIFRTEIGAISVENPVKARNEEIFDFGELKKISAYAKQNGIGLHLDGARLHMASAYSGIAIKEYAKLFDTIYLSLYKYFGATAGAVLCGPAPIIDRMAHLIKICGGNMATNWDTCGVALHIARGFETRYQAAVAKSKLLFKKLNDIPGVKVEPFANGSNKHKLTLSNKKYIEFATHLVRKENILMTGPTSDGSHIPIKVNESLNFMDLDAMAESFRAAYNASSG